MCVPWLNETIVPLVTHHPLDIQSLSHQGGIFLLVWCVFWEMFNHPLPPSPPFAQVLAGRQRQIQEKMELNRRAQEESIKYREQLIKELEEAKKEGTRREKEQEEELQRAHRRELQAQVGLSSPIHTWLVRPPHLTPFPVHRGQSAA